jgi:hypothetical protein
MLPETFNLAHHHMNWNECLYISWGVILIVCLHSMSVYSHLVSFRLCIMRMPSLSSIIVAPIHFHIWVRVLGLAIIDEVTADLGSVKMAMVSRKVYWISLEVI